MILHLPGALKDSKHPKQARMVSACGRRGPIRARKQLHVQLDAFDLGHVADQIVICPGCVVAWDKAEEAGGVLEMFSANGNQAWSSGGAPLFYEEPNHRPLRWRAKGQPSRKLVVIVRTEKAPKLGTPPALQPGYEPNRSS